MRCRWPIARRWTIRNPHPGTQILITGQLADYSAICLLGAAGLGKTFELAALAEIEMSKGRQVFSQNLAMIASDASGLRGELNCLASQAAKDDVLILDSLDEAMVPIAQAAGVLEAWISRSLAQRPLLRIACRSPVWPNIITRALEAAYGADGVISIELLPLDLDDIRLAAKTEGIDPDSFISMIQGARAFPLASRPLTLQMLLDEFRASGAVQARNRNDLFRRAVYRLCAETEERRDRGTARFYNNAEYVALAEKVALITLLSACDYINDTHSQIPSTIHLHDLESFGLDGDKLRKLFATGLFMSENRGRIRFFHRQIAEHLAGILVARLPMHQARAMLSRDGGHKAGISGPLQEVAAWAASSNPDIATWIADTDPELIGRSEVTDDSLRQKAMQHVLTKFRNSQLTMAQLHKDDIFFIGLRYPNVEDDLRPILQERGSDLEDLHACVLEIADQWHLADLSDVIATLALDPGVPMSIRGQAANVITQIGDEKAKKRLKALVYGTEDDTFDDLKGNALYCNWPDRMDESELLTALTIPRARNYYGMYKHFVHQLAVGQIAQPRASLEALEWACELSKEVEEETGFSSLAGQIRFRALDQIQDPAVRRLLVQYLLRDHGMRAEPFYVHSPGKIELESNDVITIKAKFKNDPALRRQLIKELVELSETEIQLFQAVRSVHGLADIADFSWLLDQAQSSHPPQAAKYAQMGAWLPWHEDEACFELWIRSQSLPVIAKHFPPILVRLDSEAASKGREIARLMSGEDRVAVKPVLSRSEQISIFLQRCSDNPRWFGLLTRAMGLTDDGIEKRYERYLMKTEGWKLADATIRASIVNAAKRLLAECPDVASSAERLPLSRIPIDGAIAAFFFLIQLEPSYFELASDSFWDSWGGYLMRELRFRMNDEPSEPKVELIMMLHRCRPQLIPQGIARFARMAQGESTLRSIFEALSSIEDKELGDLLCTLVGDRSVRGETLSIIMTESLRRSPVRAVSACTCRLSPKSRAKQGTPTVRAAVALLSVQPEISWEKVIGFFERRLDIARLAIGQLAYEERVNRDIWLESLGEERGAQFLQLLFTVFPPKDDPHHEGAHWVGPVDSAIFWRDRLIDLLSKRGSREAILTLRQLEHRFKGQYPWLRHSRAAAERKAKDLGWTPLDAREIALALKEEGSWLLRSEDDLLDFLCIAIDRYAAKLLAFPALVQNLWNTPPSSKATPKEEGVVTNNLLVAIKDYVHDLPIVAEREVQLRPRMLPGSCGGEPGQEIDILVEAPLHKKDGGLLKVVIEVKCSYNKDCREAMISQLVNRYLLQNDLTHGIYIVAYFDAPAIPNNYKPKWTSIEDARIYLEMQAKAQTSQESGLRVMSSVLDLRMR